MPSFIIPGGGLWSGGADILSGNYWSGLGAVNPVGGVQLLADIRNSGAVYIAYSGGMTITSGGLGNNSSGFPNFSGRMDGTPIYPGGALLVPKLVFTPFSGNPQLYALADAACSGQARLYLEAY